MRLLHLAVRNAAGRLFPEWEQPFSLKGGSGSNLRKKFDPR
jgi:hypothetical protein